MTVRILLGALLLTGALAWSADLPRPATPLMFRSEQGETVKLEEQRGKVVAVLFFSTDCPHCQETVEMLEGVYKEYEPRGVEILGIAVNPSAVMNLPEFVKQYNVAFPMGLGTSAQWTSFAGMPATARAYVPHLLLVDRQGRVVEDHPGLDREFWLDQEAKLREAFDRLLKKAAS